jgi:nucleotide-binding universal stress UspA family protein
MRTLPSRSPAIVVGIDGSRSAIDAALWAVAEAVSRDIPLRLVYAIAPRYPRGDADDAARDLATAEIAVRMAMMAVESTGGLVKIEVEIAQGHAVRVLRDLSYSTQMLCLGSQRLRQESRRRVGSTATALADTSHCPVAIVRARCPALRGPRWIVAEVDESPDSHDVLDRAVAEALLRKASLRVLTVWQSRFSDMSGSQGVAENNRIVRAWQKPLLDGCRSRHPELDVRAVAVPCSTLNYLASNAASTELVVIGRRRYGGLTKLQDLACQSALHDLPCSVLICPAPSTA